MAFILLLLQDTAPFQRGLGIGKEVETMECPRCQGLMLYEEFMDLEESDEYTFYGWRCIACGNIVDETIVHNRSHGVTLPEPRRRRRSYAH